MVNRHVIAGAPEPPEMAVAETLLDGLFSSVFRDVHDFPGSTDYNLGTRHGSVRRVNQALNHAINVQLLDSVTYYRTSTNRLVMDLATLKEEETVTDSFRMFYLGPEAGRYLLHRDRVPANRSVGRHNSARQQDHRQVRPHRRHTLDLDDVVTGLVLGGFHVRSGRRDLVNSRPLPRGARWPYGKRLPQIVPDAVLRTEVFLKEAFIEEVPDVWGREIQTSVDELLAPYLAAPEPLHQPVLLVCQGDALAAIVREQAKEAAGVHGASLEVEVIEQGTYYYQRADDAVPEKLMMCFATYEFLLEYERSARNPRSLHRKLRSYIGHAKWGVRKRLAFVAETARSEAVAITQARQLLTELDVSMEIVASNYERITVALPAGDRDVWTCVGTPLVIV